MTYDPQPLDVTSIELPVELRHLVEQMAKNIHDIWALERKSDGWNYGSHRDDVAKTNPCLVPYDALPEQEKKYDLRIAEDTIKSILLLGYDIINTERNS